MYAEVSSKDKSMTRYSHLIFVGQQCSNAFEGKALPT
jgi:hypothetical protein